LRNILYSIFAAAAVLGVSTAALAITVSESTDFSNTVGSEFFLPGGTTQVTGTATNDNDGELLRFGIGADATVTFDLDFLSGDANLLLFNGVGNPLEGDDDDGSGFDSRITIFLTAGEYLIGIGANNFAGFDAGVNEIIDNDNGNCASARIRFCGNPSGILAFVANEFDPLGNGVGGPIDWVLDFSVATSSITQAPEPGTWALLGIGLLGLVAARRRKVA
jgi:hypothetical protein